MKTALLSVQRLSVGIRKGNKTMLTAVEDISFDIYPGEIVGILGESGCGKSLTCLSIPGLLSGGVQVSGGSAFFSRTSGRQDLFALPEKELCGIRGKEISMVFQEPYASLNPLLKIGGQIAESLYIHGEKDKAGAERKVLGLMEDLGLEEPEKLLDAYPHRLSGGMCQRVMIALAMICRPRLLIADEPTTALDVTVQAQILDLMKRINAEYGTSILFVSHDLSVISRLCDRVLVMYAGRLVEEGNAAEVFSRPGHEYTRGLIGSIPGKNSKGRDLANIPGKVPSVEDKRPPGCPFAPRCRRAAPACKAAFPEERITGENHKVHCIPEASGHG
ncbi:MAG: ABC transporter ATP-binding protein [Treponema sp.]|jgi:peptide/nickel transport system ATP-binding protein|nr:ABC transporter ATP-binding protein [Treponema sp.]